MPFLFSQVPLQLQTRTLGECLHPSRKGSSVQHHSPECWGESLSGSLVHETHDTRSHSHSPFTLPIHALHSLTFSALSMHTLHACFSASLWTGLGETVPVDSAACGDDHTKGKGAMNPHGLLG